MGIEVSATLIGGIGVVVSATVGVAGGSYVAFDGMMLAPAGEPRAAASRLAHLLGLIHA